MSVLHAICTSNLAKTYVKEQGDQGGEAGTKPKVPSICMVEITGSSYRRYARLATIDFATDQSNVQYALRGGVPKGILGLSLESDEFGKRM